MSLLHPQLAAFAAVIEEGSFDGAAKRLCVTSSAISQRVKALEDRLGQVLIVRQPPCRPTEAGQLLLRRVKSMQVLEAEAFEAFQLDQGDGIVARRLTIAVNDDSLETWVLPAIAELNRQYGYLFDVVVDDQDHSLDLLRDGTAIGAITSDSKAIQGCDIHLLGTMRYQAIGSPEFIQRYFPTGVSREALAKAPMMVFNRKDELQNRFIKSKTHDILSPPTHYLPTSKGFVEAAALGLGWCMVPECMIEADLGSNRVAMLDESNPVDVPLYWQHGAIRSTTLMNLTRIFRDHGQNVLINVAN